MSIEYKGYVIERPSFGFDYVIVHINNGLYFDSFDEAKEYIDNLG